MNFTDLLFIPFVLAVLGFTHLQPWGQSVREWFLTLASWAFYSIWDPRFLPLVVGITVVSHAGALLLDRLDGAGRRRALAVLVGLLLAPLLFFKYTLFVLDSMASLLGIGPVTSLWGVGIVLPIGISFFTFHAVSYVCDVHVGKVAAEISFRRYALYIAFFPQLVAGPIIRAPDFLPQLHRPWAPPGARQAMFQINRFLWGMLKKVCIADPLASSLVDPTFANLSQASGGTIILATFAFGLQIYADFSAYSDMALATSRLLGFRLKENFAAPYLATSPKEFWQRWHISLSTLIRDYVYFPLGGSRGVSGLRAAVNALAAMLLCGLWHGASWTFVLWGGLHGLALAIGRVLPGSALPSRLRKVLGWLATQAVVMGLWFLFRLSGFADLGIAFERIAATGLLPYDLTRAYLGVLAVAAGVLYAEQAVILAWPRAGRRLRLAVLGGAGRHFVLALVQSLIILALLDPNRGGASFIYFQF